MRRGMTEDEMKGRKGRDKGGRVWRVMRAVMSKGKDEGKTEERTGGDERRLRYRIKMDKEKGGLDNN